MENNRKNEEDVSAVLMVKFQFEMVRPVSVSTVAVGTQTHTQTDEMAIECAGPTMNNENESDGAQCNAAAGAAEPNNEIVWIKQEDLEEIDFDNGEHENEPNCSTKQTATGAKADPLAIQRSQNDIMINKKNDGSK